MHLHLHPSLYMHLSICNRTHICLSMLLSKHTCTYVYLSIYVHLNLSIHLDLPAYLPVCVSVSARMAFDNFNQSFYAQSYTHLHPFPNPYFLSVHLSCHVRLQLCLATMWNLIPIYISIYPRECKCV